MKKTTYIILALLAFTVITAIATFPVLLATAKVPDGLASLQIPDRIDLNNRGLADTITVDSITKINTEYEFPIYIDSDSTEYRYANYCISIIEDPQLTQPIVVVNRGWKDYVTVTDENNVLNIDIDFHTIVSKFEADYGKHTYFSTDIYSDRYFNQVAEVHVPTGMLREVSTSDHFMSDIVYSLRDFKDASLTVCSDCIMTNCSFRTLSTNTEITTEEVVSAF